MDLEVYALPGHLPLPAADGSKDPAPVCIVLDVIRATSSILLLFERGAARVHVGRDLASGRRLAEREPGRYVDCGEDAFGRRAPGFSWSTSPTELGQAPVRGREVIFCTVNGTGCIHAAVAAGARAVLVGGFRNASAVAARAADMALSADAPVIVVGSGRHGNRTTALDDVFCAGYLGRLVWNRLEAAGRQPLVSDSVRVAEAVYRAYPSRLDGLRDSGSGRGLLAQGMPLTDLELCAALDTTAIVPEVPLGGARPEHPVDLIIEDAEAGTLADAAEPASSAVRGRSWPRG